MTPVRPDRAGTTAGPGSALGCGQSIHVVRVHRTFLKLGIHASTGAAGDAPDNALTESWIALHETELRGEAPTTSAASSPAGDVPLLGESPAVAETTFSFQAAVFCVFSGNPRKQGRGRSLRSASIQDKGDRGFPGNSQGLPGSGDVGLPEFSHADGWHHGSRHDSPRTVTCAGTPHMCRARDSR